MRKREFILTALIGTFLMWGIILGTLDIFNFLDDKDTYSKVHHLDMSKKGFEWDYLQRNVLLISIGLIGLTIIGLRLSKPNDNGIKKANSGLIGLTLLFLVIGLIRFLNNEF